MNSSGTSTPFPTDSTADDETAVADEETEILEKEEIISDKALRKESFGKAVIVVKPLTPTSADTSLSKEHSEQGQVKRDVYQQYIRAASIFGFFVFVAVTIGQQVATICSNPASNGSMAWPAAAASGESHGKHAVKKDISRPPLLERLSLSFPT